MNDNKPYRQIIALNESQCDLSGHLTLSHLFQQLQEIASDDSDRLGMGRPFIARENIIWVLSRVAMTIERMPEWTEAVAITTWHGPTVRYIYPRYFTVEDGQGNRIAEASTLWMLIDRDKREIVFPSLRGYSMPDPPAETPAIEAPGKIALPFALDRNVQRSPLYSDFDTNGHMNNARYPLWICDLFPPALYLTSYMDSFKINYVREIMQGERVDMNYGMQGDVFGVRGSVEGDCRFEACGTFHRYGG